MGAICAIILAAGESKRMGFPKMLLDFNGKSMLEKVIENVKESDVDHILVVLGAEREKITELVRNLNVSYCYNDNYKQGMLSSVRCGVSNIPEDCDAILVFQGDQPFITREVINRVIETYRSSEKEIVIPVCEGKRGHPLLVGRKYIKKIELLDDNEGLRSLANLYPGEVLEIGTNNPAILRDIDTYDEYKNELNQIQ